MKTYHFLIIPVLLFTGIVLAKDPLYYAQVTAVGPTAEIAQQRAFKDAIKQAVGVLVLNEVEVPNQTVIRNNTTIYSSGMIERFKIIDQSVKDGQVQITVDVWVSNSRIADRLMSISKANGKIEGNQIAARERSYFEERQSANAVINDVLHDYPYRAFDINITDIKSGHTASQSYILITVNVKWSNTFVTGLAEAFHRTENTASKDATFSVGGSKYWIDQDTYHRLVLDMFIKDKLPLLRIKGIGENGRDAVIDTCLSNHYALQELYGHFPYNKALAIPGNRNSEKVEMEIWSGEDRESFLTKIEHISKFEVEAGGC
jgi:hypothetical protein